ncbi:hypothetical protein BDQ12DRAFT_728716 [Crucibulum laeve]|uniref:Uncharacterized protein n=1 Tax=Crucibulum laeve TaxID=68775 RepID=A0A5C3LHL4_9AGAR|nr:hypothetical protein BDQ12DRAFT_728716 [Crucibulum laeve]
MAALPLTLEQLRDLPCSSPPRSPVTQTPQRSPASAAAAQAAEGRYDYTPAASDASSHVSTNFRQLFPNSDDFSSSIDSPFRNPRKRAGAVDISQYVDAIAREKKLKVADHASLTKFSKRSDDEKNILIYASVLEIQQQLSALTPPDVIYTLPKALEHYIGGAVFNALMNPTIVSYVGNTAVNAVIEYLEANPNSGFTPEIKNNKKSYDTVLKRVCDKLSDRRYDIKRTLEKSLYEPRTPKQRGNDDQSLIQWLKVLNIIELGESLLRIEKRCSEVRLNVQLLARVAFLRQVFIETGPNNPNYWEIVDSQLEETRSSYADDPKAAKKISKFFVWVLQADQAAYGNVDLPAEP